MIETLFGSLLGGIFRLVPEMFKFFDRKDERKHELAMLDKNLEADRLKAEHGEKLAQIESDRALGVAELSGLIEATKAQAIKTGIGFVDAINSLMRPMITFWWVILLNGAALAAQFIVLMNGGEQWFGALLKLWGPDEKAIVASIVSFWFIDRALRKGAGC